MQVEQKCDTDADKKVPFILLRFRDILVEENEPLSISPDVKYDK